MKDEHIQTQKLYLDPDNRLASQGCNRLMKNVVDKNQSLKPIRWPNRWEAFQHASV
uniref:Uncharacterized protein n=1 Tax=Nelumbo nucifera TaxID=4432 RepID=A0A822ZCW2_NELNU|nr:TPA_asm: hypothetical protein HUJ06_000977 [Nelumbo nucifera]